MISKQGYCMNKNILFLVTGMTPQIITETLWALACDPSNDEQWVPDEIHVASTEHGLNQIRARLFEQGNFAKMQQEYPHLAQVKFTVEQLNGICDTEGMPLNDLKTPEDNELAADFICSKIRSFTTDNKVSLHVSIAGGRKTMGFYAGYALSLYGRAQDRMSHVLVDERYENAKDFYYPSTNANTFAYDRDGKAIGSTHNAKIWLAQIPFVRMKEAINEKHQLNQSDSFSQVVKKINESFNEVTLLLDIANTAVTVNDKFTFKLPPREFAFIHMFAVRRLNGGEGIRLPTKKMSDKKITTEEIQGITDLSIEYRELYSMAKPTIDEDELNELDFDKAFVEGVKSRMKTKLEEELGLELAAKINLTQQGRGMPFSLSLPKEHIQIISLA